MKPIVRLEKDIDVLEKAKESILRQWLSFDDVMEILQKHHIEASYFHEHFASDIFNYYVGVVKKEKEIGDCPVMNAFLNYLKEHDISSAELFLICTHFRKAMLDELFELGRISKELFDEVSYVFDLNFSGVLDQYSGRIYSAQRETKVHKRRFEEYNLAIDHSAMVCKTDSEGIITYVNPRFTQISGYAQDELVGLAAAQFQEAMDSEYLADEMWQQLRRKEIFHGILKSKTKQGKEYYTETTIVPMLDLEGNIQEYLAIRYDVSELIHTRDAALEAERTKDQFLANMSHEIRTPLNAILGFVAVLRKRIKDSENSRYLDVIHSSGETLLSIIGDILDFAKIKEGKLQLDPHEFDPMKEFSNTLELFSSKMFEKHIEYLSYIDPNLPSSIKTDAVRIRQIVTNFLSNALKFTPENGLVTVTVKLKENNLIISVKDSGCGIEEEALSRIFSAFEQAEGSTTRKYGGTGLGLSICQRLCDMLNGDIEVESKIGKGSLFRLIIPVEGIKRRSTYEKMDVYLQESDEKSMYLLQRYLQEMGMSFVTAPSSSSVNFYYHTQKVKQVKPYVIVSSTPLDELDALIPAFDANKIMRFMEGQKINIDIPNEAKLQYTGHILVAEDNRANQMLMRLMLEEYGLTYEICENGKETYEAFIKGKFSLVLMDEQMPVMGGLEAAQKIIEYEIADKLKHTPIISVTANALKGDKEYFLAAGMDGYVAKPIESVKLEKILNKFIPNQGVSVNQNTELPSYNNLSAEEMAAKIGLNAKHIPILVQSFTDESIAIMEKLEQAITSMDYEGIANQAHSIKGSSGNLKFTEMYELAKDVELSAKDKKKDYPYAEACSSIKKAIESISL